MISRPHRARNVRLMAKAVRALSLGVQLLCCSAVASITASTTSSYTRGSGRRPPRTSVSSSPSCTPCAAALRAGSSEVPSARCRAKPPWTNDGSRMPSVLAKPGMSSISGTCAGAPVSTRRSSLMIESLSTVPAVLLWFIGCGPPPRSLVPAEYVPATEILYRALPRRVEQAAGSSAHSMSSATPVLSFAGTTTEASGAGDESSSESEPEECEL